MKIKDLKQMGFKFEKRSNNTFVNATCVSLDRVFGMVDEKVLHGFPTNFHLPKVIENGQGLRQLCHKAEFNPGTKAWGIYIPLNLTEVSEQANLPWKVYLEPEYDRLVSRLEGVIMASQKLLGNMQGFSEFCHESVVSYEALAGRLDDPRSKFKKGDVQGHLDLIDQVQRQHRSSIVNAMRG